jgi:Flp pilus assembly protein TadD
MEVPMKTVIAVLALGLSGCVGAPRLTASTPAMIVTENGTLADATRMAQAHCETTRSNAVLRNSIHLGYEIVSRNFECVPAR